MSRDVVLLLCLVFLGLLYGLSKRALHDSGRCQERCQQLGMLLARSGSEYATCKDESGTLLKVPLSSPPGTTP